METAGIKLIECPRDAMQGWKHFIPTATKIEYLNSLLKVGFDTLDCGSFVSPKAIPQLADTAEVISKLSLSQTKTKLLVIVANLRGAEDAVKFDNVHFIGFPFSISPTFQLRNTNSTIEESLRRVEEIQNLCVKYNRQLVIYLSMGFGNPYGDDYNEQVLMHWANEMVKQGIKIISLADTVGVASPNQIGFALQTLIPKYPDTEIGVHLHTSPHNLEEKIKAAINFGCKRIDGALKGIGGCPMAKDELIGNMNTELTIQWLKDYNHKLNIDEDALAESLQMAEAVFK